MSSKQKIFVRRLPQGTTRTDLKNFLRQGLKTSLFGLSFLPSDELGNVQIIKIVSKDAGTVEFHGIAEIYPCKGIESVIHKLNGKTIRNRPLEVHRYYQRSPNNDRRNPFSDNMDRSDDNRVNDRRRDHLFIQKEHSPKIEGMESFARSYG